MGASSSKPTTQSLPCTSLSFSPPVWPPLSLRLFPLRLMLDTAPDTPVPLLVDTLLPQLPMLLAQLPMPLPQLLVLVSPRLPPMAFPQSDRLPRLPSSRTSSSPLSSGDTRLPTKQSNFNNINKS